LEASTLNDGGNEQVQIQLDESRINHDNLAGYVANEHIDHSGVSITGASGELTGGGDITANRELGLADTAVTPGSYGDAQTVATFTVDQKGRLTAAGTATIDDTTKIPLTQKAAANGVATLDGTGKIPSAQLPVSATEYLGAWNASTNTPTLADGTGTNGDFYRVSVGGTQDLGSGNVTFAAGDIVIYNGTIWQDIPSEDLVQSVNGFQGVVVLTTSDIAEGTNEYFTDEKAQDAVGTILTDSATIDFTYDDGVNTITAVVIDGSIDEAKLAGSVAGEGLSGGAGTPLSVSHAPQVTKSVTVDEACAANTSFLMRYAQTGETAGRVRKATSGSAAANENFYAVCIVLSGSALSAGDSVDAVFMGTHTLGSSDANFATGDIGKPVYLTSGGAFSVTPPSASGSAVYRIGVVEDVDKIWVDAKQLNGILA
jgi:hypothetical protein